MSLSEIEMSINAISPKIAIFRLHAANLCVYLVNLFEHIHPVRIPIPMPIHIDMHIEKGMEHGCIIFDFRFAKFRKSSFDKNPATRHTIAMPNAMGMSVNVICVNNKCSCLGKAMCILFKSVKME